VGRYCIQGAILDEAENQLSQDSELVSVGGAGPGPLLAMPKQEIMTGTCAHYSVGEGRNAEDANQHSQTTYA